MFLTTFCNCVGDLSRDTYRPFLWSPLAHLCTCLHVHTASTQTMSIPKAPHVHHGPFLSRKTKPEEQFNCWEPDNKALTLGRWET